MVDMDVKVIPDEGPADCGSDAGFEKYELPENVKAEKVGPDTDVTRMVKMKFPNFAKLVATHSFEDILSKNEDEDIIIPADLLADLANADLVEDEKKKRLIMVLGGVVVGILIALVFLGGL